MAEGSLASKAHCPHPQGPHTLEWPSWPCCWPGGSSPLPQKCVLQTPVVHKDVSAQASAATSGGTCLLRLREPGLLACRCCSRRRSARRGMLAQLRLRALPANTTGRRLVPGAGDLVQRANGQQLLFCSPGRALLRFGAVEGCHEALLGAGLPRRLGRDALLLLGVLHLQRRCVARRGAGCGAAAAPGLLPTAPAARRETKPRAPPLRLPPASPRSRGRRPPAPAAAGCWGGAGRSSFFACRSCALFAARKGPGAAQDASGTPPRRAEPHTPVCCLRRGS